MDERFDLKKPINPVETILHTSRYRYALKKLEMLGNKKTVLDIACGTGYGSNLLIHNSRVIGIDKDRKVLKEAKKRYRRVKFMYGSITKIPLPTNSVDCIVCFETIEHISSAEGYKAFSEFYRVLKKKGILIISSPNKYYTRILKKLIPTYTNEHHKHEYEIDEIMKMFRSKRFSILDAAGQYPFLPPLYLIGQITSFVHWFFKPTTYLPQALCRYFLFTVQKT